MKDRSRMMWVPAVVIAEVRDLQVEHNLAQRTAAFEKMVDYARVGREIERIAQFRTYPPTKRRRM